MNAQADLNLRWALMAEGTFSDVSAQMALISLLTVELIKRCLITSYAPEKTHKKQTNKRSGDK